MPNKDEMQKVLDSLESYLKSVDNFQRGKKTSVDADSLDQLEKDVLLDPSKTKKSEVNPEHKSKSFSQFIMSIENVSFEEDVIPYTLITKLIYKETKYNRELFDMLEDTLISDWSNYQKGKNEISPETTRKFLKIKEHIGLSIIQRYHISDRLKEQLEETQEKLKEMDGKYKNMSESLDLVEEQAQEKADKIVVQFIAILGIFAAIMMGAIGSFQGFTSIFSNAENIPIGKTLIISAAGASGVSLILFLLLHAISKLTSFPLSNCDCKKRRKNRTALGLVAASIRSSLFGEDTDPECTCSLFNKYPTIFIANYLFYYIAVTGFVFMYFKFKNYFEMTQWKHWIVIVGFYLLVTIILIMAHRYVIDKDSDEKSLYKFVKDIKRTPSYIKGAFKN